MADAPDITDGLQAPGVGTPATTMGGVGSPALIPGCELNAPDSPTAAMVARRPPQTFGPHGTTPAPMPGMAPAAPAQPHPLFEMLGIQPAPMTPQAGMAPHTPGTNYGMDSAGVGLNPGGVGSGGVGLKAEPMAWNQDTQVAMAKRQAGQRPTDPEWKLLVDHDHYEEQNGQLAALSQGPKDAEQNRVIKEKQDKMQAGADMIDSMYAAAPEQFNQWGFHPNTASLAEKAAMLPTMLKAMQGHINEQQKAAATDASNAEREKLAAAAQQAASARQDVTLKAASARQDVTLKAASDRQISTFDQQDKLHADTLAAEGKKLSNQETQQRLSRFDATNKLIAGGTITDQTQLLQYQQESNQMALSLGKPMRFPKAGLPKGAQAPAAAAPASAKPVAKSANPVDALIDGALH